MSATILPVLFILIYVSKTSPSTLPKPVLFTVKDVIKIRSPMRSLCGFITLHEVLEKVSFLTDILAAGDNHVQSYTFFPDLSAKSFHHSNTDFRFSVPCVHVLTSGLEVNALSKKWVAAHLFRREVSMVHFVFFDRDDNLLRLFENPVIKSLKYKTGIVVTDSGSSYSHALVTDDTGSTQLHSSVQPLPTGIEMFTNRILKIELLAYQPYVVVDAGRKPISGVCYNLALVAARMLNFSYILSADPKPLDRLPNGTWRGTMFDLTEGDTDVLFGLGAIIQRYPYFDYTGEIFSVSSLFFTSHPEVSLKWQSLLHPFHALVWILIMFTYIASVPVFYFSLSSHSPPLTKNKERLADDLFIAFSVPLCAVLQESFKIPHKAKFMSVMFVFFALIVSTCYNSNLTSCLTLPEPEVIPDTFEALARVGGKSKGQYNVTLCYVPGSISTTLLEQSSSPLHMRLNSIVYRERKFVQCLHQAAFKPRSACICYDRVAFPLIAATLSLYPTWVPLKPSKDRLLQTFLHGLLQKNSRYTTDINNAVSAVRESGLATKWIFDVNELNRVKAVESFRKIKAEDDHLVGKIALALSKSEMSKLQPFTLENFVLCYALLVGGLVLAMIAFSAETLLHIMFRAPITG